jgi:hypothetical protein
VDRCPEHSEPFTVVLAFLNMSIHSDTLVEVAHCPHTVYVSVYFNPFSTFCQQKRDTTHFDANLKWCSYVPLLHCI